MGLVPQPWEAASLQRRASKRATPSVNTDEDDEVVFLSEGVEAAAAPPKPKRARKHIKLERSASGEDREDDAQDAADELLAPSASMAKAERKKRARKPSNKVRRMSLPQPALLLVHLAAGLSSSLTAL